MKTDLHVCFTQIHVYIHKYFFTCILIQFQNAREWRLAMESKISSMAKFYWQYV